MDLLTEIRIDLINESASLSNTLRKARILAEQLEFPELRDWVKSEIEGYQNDDVPEYRLLHLPVYGTFTVPLQRRTETVDISSNLPQQLRDKVQEIAVVYKIAVLEEMLVSDDKESHRTFPVERTNILRQAVQMSDGAMMIEAYQRLPHVFLAGILDSVKSRLLDFVLDLQGMNATPEALSDGSVAPEIIRNSFHFHINGNNNTVAVGENVSQTVSTVHKGDVESLKAHLRAHNIDEVDLSELASAVTSESTGNNGQFGARVNAWVGKMGSKAISGAWQYSVENALPMLVEAIKSYYGA